MRTVVYITGSRADYGPARQVLQRIQATPDLDLRLLVTGMHLDPLHGETWKEIASDGLPLGEHVYGRVTGDSLTTMAASIGLYLYGMSQALGRLQPDIVLVLGDRGEQLAGAMAAAFQNRVVVHLCGGSLSGSIDDSIRHALTKFAHYHLPAHPDHARRILQMGEDPETVRVVGLPGGDIRSDVVYSRAELCAEFGLPVDQPYLLVIQHPVSHAQDQAVSQVSETLEAVARSGYPTLLANPNDDAGGREILKTMQAYAERYATLCILPPLSSREKFASLMAHAGALVGNSSAGIVEAMSVHLPVVNVGDRQRGRQDQAVLLNTDYDREQVFQAIETALHDPAYRRRLKDFTSPWLNVDTPAAVVDCLQTLDPSRAAHPKPFIDLPMPGSAGLR